MSNAPYILDKARGGYRMGHGKMYDHMFLDGLEDAYDKGQLMGVFADDTARKLQITREEQDAFALASLSRAQRAVSSGDFVSEIVSMTVKSKAGDTVVSEDDQTLLQPNTTLLVDIELPRLQSEDVFQLKR